tara:strand:- start:67 stop:903 length:837 start_codon:yes stop_codon:yes gene_type:complete
MVKKKISIIKDQDNWYMSSKSGYKVKNEIVRKNLIQISELRFFEKKTQDESLYSRLNLDYPNDEDGDSKHISIINNDKQILVEFILGKKKKDGVYIKKMKDKETWLTSGNLDMSSVEEDWLEIKILDIDYQDVKKVSIDHLNKKNESFSLTKDDINENFLIDNLTKEQIPKSDLIANFIGYFFTNLTFEDVIKREDIVGIKFLTKMNFELFDGTSIFASIYDKDNDKWINIEIEDQSELKLKDNEKNFVNDIKNWSYKLSSKKYNVINTKFKDLLVEN